MATKSSKGIQPSNSTDAFFRAWSKFIFDTMVAGGWVQTADTGQINFTTVTRPTLTNEQRGYVIMRMDDALQATAPVFLKMGFGSSGAANNMGVWLTLGASSDGAGTINNPWLSNASGTAPLVQAANNSTSLVQPYSWGSAGKARLQVVVAHNFAAVANSILISLERTKTGAGSDDATGLLLFYTASGGSVNRNQFLFAADVSQPPVEQGSQAILPLRNPGVTSQNWGISVPFPFAGLAQQPGKGILVTQTGDATIYGRFAIDVYGERITYNALFSYRLPGFNHDGVSIVLLRFD